MGVFNFPGGKRNGSHLPDNEHNEQMEAAKKVLGHEIKYIGLSKENCIIFSAAPIHYSAKTATYAALRAFGYTFGRKRTADNTFVRGWSRSPTVKK